MSIKILEEVFLKSVDFPYGDFWDTLYYSFEYGMWKPLRRHLITQWFS